MSKWLALAGVLLACCLALPTLAQVAADRSTPASARAARARDQVRDILASPEYGREKPGKSPLERLGDVLLSPVKRFFKWLGEKLEGLSLPTPSGVLGQILMYAFYGVLISLAVLLLAKLVVGLARRGAQRASAGNKKPAVSSTMIEEPEPAAEPDTWIEVARRHAAEGDMRSAYRAAFTAVLVRLDRLGAIRYERQRTNGEYVRALRGHPQYLAAVRPAARDFDARWYGHLPVQQADFERMLATYTHIAGEPVA